VTVPAPLTPAGCNLQDFPHTPILRSRLFGSSFHARTTDSEWRAGVTLWLKAWEQVPAGSLPDDDIELCRLAELARDMKTWKKLRAGAMRGWMVCSDGRLYHPVVAEVVNTALAAKEAQRAKTYKARLAALEKRLSEAKTDTEKEHLTEEIKKLKQSQSQTLSQPPREGKGREGKEKGLDNPSGEGGKPPADEKAETEKARLWREIKTMLVQQGKCQTTKEAGTLIGACASKYGNDIFLDAIRATLTSEPADAHTFLIGLCERAAGNRPSQNKQEALEAGNMAATARFAQESDHATF
jgi:hypothetical protein